MSSSDVANVDAAPARSTNRVGLSLTKPQLQCWNEVVMRVLAGGDAKPLLRTEAATELMSIMQRALNRSKLTVHEGGAK